MARRQRHAAQLGSVQEGTARERTSQTEVQDQRRLSRPHVPAWAGSDETFVTHPYPTVWVCGSAVGSGQIGDQSEFPLPGPGDVAGPWLFHARLLACAPAWLLPGRNDQPDAIGPITVTPWSPLCASAFATPSPTAGHRNAPSVAGPSGGAARRERSNNHGDDRQGALHTSVHFDTPSVRERPELSGPNLCHGYERTRNRGVPITEVKLPGRHGRLTGLARMPIRAGGSPVDECCT